MRRFTLALAAVLTAALLLGAMSANAAKPAGSADGPGAATELAKKKGKKGKKGCKKKGGKKKGRKGKKSAAVYKAKGGKKKGKGCKKKGGKKKPSKPGKPKPPKPDETITGNFTLEGTFDDHPDSTIEMQVSVKQSVPVMVRGIKVTNVPYKCVGGGADGTWDERISFEVRRPITSILEGPLGIGLWFVQDEVREARLESYEVNFLLRDSGRLALPNGRAPVVYKWRDEAADADCTTTEDWDSWEAKATEG